MSANAEMNLEQEGHERLCAYVFGELEGEERAAFERELAASPALQAEKARLEATVALVKTAVPEERLSAEAKSDLVASARRSRFRLLGRRPLELLVAAAVLVVGAAAALRFVQGRSVELLDVRDGGAVARAPALQPGLKQRTLELSEAKSGEGAAVVLEEPLAFDSAVPARSEPTGASSDAAELRDELTLALGDDSSPAAESPDFGAFAITWNEDALERVQAAVVQPSEPAGPGNSLEAEALFHGLVAGRPGAPTAGPTSPAASGPSPVRAGPGLKALVPGSGGPAAPATPPATGSEGWFLGQGEKKKEESEAKPKQVLNVLPEGTMITKRRALFEPTQEDLTDVERYLADQASRMSLRQDSSVAEEPPGDPILTRADKDSEFEVLERVREIARAKGIALWEPATEAAPSAEELARRTATYLALLRPDGEESPRDMFFRWFGEAPFVLTDEERVSTFAADVDTASYALMRAYLKRGELPPREAVRTEEFVNYFRADQPAPTDGQPFALTLELAPSPFAADARTEILRVAVRARDVADFERKPVALTLVVDNSGSMQEGGRLELVKRALSLLLRELRPGDSVALVKFSENASVVTSALPATRRGELETLIGALPIEGGTNVEAGLTLGYEQALAALVPGAVNRIVLCSDGVGNIGETEAKALLARVEEARSKGLYLNTVGVGMGNHDDAFLEELADKGDGVCHYVDSDAEAKRVFVDGLASAFQPVARDVKLQVEFDAALVERWRLLGYENRALRSEDFRNDAVDAGEVNAGHQVTALYELVRNPGSGPVATARVRYKPPFALDGGRTGERAAAENEVARELERTVRGGDVLPGFAAGSPGFRRAVLAAQFAEVLRASEHARGDSFARLLQEAKAVEPRLDDADFREFLELLALANPLLDARAEAETPRVQELSDRLARLQYEAALEARKRELAAEAGEAGRAEPEADADEAARSRAQEIERLEAELREELLRILTAGR